MRRRRAAKNVEANVTEKLVQDQLYWFLKRRGHKWIFPGFTTSGPWEADIYSITRNDFSHEYEIKLTKADFLKDFEKEALVDGRKIKKHDFVKSGGGPSVFYFVVPQELLDQLTPPSYAGVLTFIRRGRKLYFSETKKPKKLSSTKVTAEVADRIRTNSYYRYWSLRQKLGG